MSEERKDIEFDIFDLALISKAVVFMLDENEDLEGQDLDSYEELNDKIIDMIKQVALKQRRQKKNGEAQ